MAAPKILVADDDKQLLPMLALHLRNEEYEVACAEDGAGAVEVARREKPDLLVVDVSLPTSDGLSMPEYLATKPDLVGIPVIYLAMERSGKGLAGGLPASMVVYKPVATSELLEKVSAVLGLGSVPTGKAGGAEAA